MLAVAVHAGTHQVHLPADLEPAPQQRRVAADEERGEVEGHRVGLVLDLDAADDGAQSLQTARGIRRLEAHAGHLAAQQGQRHAVSGQHGLRAAGRGVARHHVSAPGGVVGFAMAPPDPGVQRPVGRPLQEGAGLGGGQYDHAARTPLRRRAGVRAADRRPRLVVVRGAPGGDGRAVGAASARGVAIAGGPGGFEGTGVQANQASDLEKQIVQLYLVHDTARRVDAAALEELLLLLLEPLLGHEGAELGVAAGVLDVGALHARPAVVQETRPAGGLGRELGGAGAPAGPAMDELRVVVGHGHVIGVGPDEVQQVALAEGGLVVAPDAEELEVALQARKRERDDGVLGRTRGPRSRDQVQVIQQPHARADAQVHLPAGAVGQEAVVAVEGEDAQIREADDVRVVGRVLVRLHQPGGDVARHCEGVHAHHVGGPRRGGPEVHHERHLVVLLDEKVEVREWDRALQQALGVLDAEVDQLVELAVRARGVLRELALLLAGADEHGVGPAVVALVVLFHAQVVAQIVQHAEVAEEVAVDMEDGADVGLVGRAVAAEAQAQVEAGVFERGSLRVRSRHEPQGEVALQLVQLLHGPGPLGLPGAPAGGARSRRDGPAGEQDRRRAPHEVARAVLHRVELGVFTAHLVAEAHEAEGQELRLHHLAAAAAVDVGDVEVQAARREHVHLPAQAVVLLGVGVEGVDDARVHEHQVEGEVEGHRRGLANFAQRVQKHVGLGVLGRDLVDAAHDLQARPQPGAVLAGDLHALPLVVLPADVHKEHVRQAVARVAPEAVALAEAADQVAQRLGGVVAQDADRLRGVQQLEVHDELAQLVLVARLAQQQVLRPRLHVEALVARLRAGVLEGGDHAGLPAHVLEKVLVDDVQQALHLFLRDDQAEPLQPQKDGAARHVVLGGGHAVLVEPGVVAAAPGGPAGARLHVGRGGIHAEVEGGRAIAFLRVHDVVVDRFVQRPEEELLEGRVLLAVQREAKARPRLAGLALGARAFGLRRAGVAGHAAIARRERAAAAAVRVPRLVVGEGHVLLGVVLFLVEAVGADVRQHAVHAAAHAEDVRQHLGGRGDGLGGGRVVAGLGGCFYRRAVRAVVVGAARGHLGLGRRFSLVGAALKVPSLGEARPRLVDEAKRGTVLLLAGLLDVAEGAQQDAPGRAGGDVADGVCEGGVFRVHLHAFG
ncbi:uncharacterized protein BcabD6B2_33990 [Babesia caballi]|uniref:Uncharacterized protein n=1 Tax=Babesia caballi TaxID=5871 RepID=A0AAV4LW05_BABCB|nr:hypothetical protein BcabD6B2_33990 [Babesia caballi]